MYVSANQLFLSLADLTWTWLGGDQTVDTHRSKTNPGGHSGGCWFLHRDWSAVCMFGGERKYDKTPSLSNDLWKVDMNNKWKLLHNGSDASDMPQPRQLAAGCGIQNYYFVVFGGLGKGEKVLGDTWVYYMHDDKWYKLEDIQKKLGVTVENNATTSPPARGDAAVWCEDGQNLVVFGGFGSDNNLRHDMWVFSMSKLTWTEVESSSKLPADPDFVKHLPDYPMGRSGATTWKSGNNLYMYGGNVQHQNIRSKHLNTGNSGDLWSYDLKEDSWKFLNGHKGVCTEAGNFGVKDRPSRNNRPGCRRRASAWVDNRRNLWMFGGDGADVSQESISVVQKSKLLSDLWTFSVKEEVWIWKGGRQSGDQKGQFGEKWEADEDNLPGSRGETVAWSRGNNFYLFGGVGHDVNGKGGYLNDIWMLDVDKDPTMRPDDIYGGSVFGIIFLGLVLVLAVLVFHCFLRGYIKENRRSSIEVKYSPLELAEQ